MFNGVQFGRVRFEGHFKRTWFRNCYFTDCVFATRLQAADLAENGNAEEGSAFLGLTTLGGMQQLKPRWRDQPSRQQLPAVDDFQLEPPQRAIRTMCAVPPLAAQAV